MSRFAQDERHALCDLFLAVDSEAPTLCKGWVAGDLAAHLLIRERRPDALPGTLLPRLAEHTNEILRTTRAATKWEDLVARVRSGPPALLRPLDEAINTVEYFVHHEDVRRATASWQPRELDSAEEAALWKRFGPMGRLLARRVPLGVTIEAPGYGRLLLRHREPMVTVRGRPGELILFAFGRVAHARVDYEGDEVSVERLRHADFGL